MLLIFGNGGGAIKTNFPIMKTLTSIFLYFSMVAAYAQFNPSPEFISTNKGKWIVEIPEVQELVHIVIALTPTGRADENMVMHNTRYYADVLNHFCKYERHPLVNRIEQLLHNGSYAHLKMDACGFYFTDENQISKDKTYSRLNWNEENYVEPLVSDLQDFSSKANFRQFFKSNQKFYAEQVDLLKKQTPIDKQWRWLEERFPDRYDNYRITFSPLVNGWHCTNRFESGDFSQTVMFICGPIANPDLPGKVKEGLMTRVVFTEIDHNYVNPVSDRFEKEITEIFSDRGKWTSGGDAENYWTPVSVFNEYMTWSVFTLYALDHFDEDNFKTINEKVEKQMSDRRGFAKFSQFNGKMIQLYKDIKPGQTLEDLYPLIIDWCRNI